MWTHFWAATRWTHSRGNEYAGHSRITSVAVQRAVNKTVDEEVFPMWFAYIHCWATDVFSMDPPRDYISGTEQIQRRTRMERVLGRQGRRVRLKIGYEFL
jgi:hypothetical protein